jgi:DNA-binding HxlR family transcriptional regulator
MGFEMTKVTSYQHYCPAAMALDVIGEKWSLLVVRDLLRGPQRFTDLLKYVGGITPKWLTARLKDLEASGIVERDSRPGRREVWYRLTLKGKALGPVVESLLIWGIQYAMRPPQPGEVIHPAQTIDAFVHYNNERGTRLGNPATWLVVFTAGDRHTIRFDGQSWFDDAEPSADSDLTIRTTPLEWVNFVTSARPRQVVGLAVEGEEPYLGDFLRLFGVAADGVTPNQRKEAAGIA